LFVPFVAVACGGAADGAPAPKMASRPTVQPEDLDYVQVGCSTSPPVRRAPPEFDDADPAAVRLFYDVLTPYGTWTDDARLGLVWTPAREAVADGFVPYATHGRWTHRTVDMEGGSASEYVWVSDLPWGWVTFHYGRWTFAGDRGWAWIPGRRYAGAWVDWRAPHDERSSSRDAVVGWGPMPPSVLWRVSPGPAPSRARSFEAFDPKSAHIVAVPYAAFATPYTYVRARDLFAADLGSHLMPGRAALAVAHATEPGAPPRLEQLGLTPADVPAPPALDRGLQQAWMLATPASASAVGAGPELPSAPRLRTYVTGGPRWSLR